MADAGGTYHGEGNTLEDAIRAAHAAAPQENLTRTEIVHLGYRTGGFVGEHTFTATVRKLGGRQTETTEET